MENVINKLESVIKEEYNSKYAEWLNLSHEEQFSDMVSEMYDKQDEYSDYELNEDSGMQMQ